MNYIGIDIAKKSFDVAIEIGNSYKHYCFSNDSGGFAQFEKLLDEHSWCVMEASGPYYLKLAWYLKQRQIALSIINPLVIRRFCQMRLVRAKTDKKDAAMIAEYGKTEKPKAWLPVEGFEIELKQMQAYIDILEKNRTAYNNQLEAFIQCPVYSSEVKKGLTLLLHSIDKQIQQTEKKMQSMIYKHYANMVDRVNSIPGIGKKTTTLLLVTTKGFSRFNNHKQVSAYIGLNPRIYESGTSIKGKERISKMGMSRLRAMLYVCSWSAIKYNKACKELYNRLVQKGKAKRLALVAVANKLIKQAFVLATKNRFYSENPS